MIQNSGVIGVPIFFRYLGDEEGKTKLNHDKYELFVNSEYVGEHTLVAEKEDAADITGFLHSHGFEHIDLSVEGDHIVIHCSDQREAEQIEKTLRVFVNNR